MRIAMLSPIAWSTPPNNYGPWERFTSLLTEGLVEKGIDVTLFATTNSKTKAKLQGVINEGYEENPSINPKVWECLHISEVFEHAGEFDLIHNNFDFLPLSYSDFVTTPVVTTIHGFSSSKILPVYKKYNGRVFYVAISDADRSPELDYIARIHHGIDIEKFYFNRNPDSYLLYFGRIHQDKGTMEAIEIAGQAGINLIIAGIIQDHDYYERNVKPRIDGEKIIFVGSTGPERRNELLGGAIALLHPINFNEPFGFSVVESMACGTPVIAFNRGSMAELIRHAHNGLLVSNVEEAVDAVKQIRNIDRANCRKTAEEKFTSQRMVDNYIEVYKQIMEIRKREDHRPWGFYTILSDTTNHKIKRITVYPEKRLSLQFHRHRSEHWYIIEGNALVTHDRKKTNLKTGQSIDIAKGAIHRIENTDVENLVFIEVQRGNYLGEDDIERIEDDFGRS